MINSLNAQVKNRSLSANYHLIYKNIAHTSVQPYLESHQLELDTLRTKSKNKINKKLFDESLLNVKKKDIHITADPLFNFTIGSKNKDLDYRYYSNVRGVRITGDLTNNFSFETRFYENQFFYPDYLRQKSDSRTNTSNIEGMAFGIGRAKRFKTYGADASLANGYLSFSPSKVINFQLGHGRHFFGDGYRSLLISDYAPDYPYISGQYYLFNKKILYKHVTSWMKNLDRIPASSTPEALFIPKSSSFNILSFSPNSRFSISMFEGGVYKSFDNQNGKINPDVSFFLPIIGAKVLDIDSTNNIIYGFNWSLLLFENLKIYNQIALNPNSSSKGIQSGIKWLNPLKSSNSFLNIEWNTSSSTMFSMNQGQLNQTYAHLGHELAHPLGSGFQEILLRGQFSYKISFIRFNYNYAKIQDVYNGNEIFEPLENILSNTKTYKTRLFLNTNIGIMLNKETNMEISIGHMTRKNNNLLENYIFLSWRTNLKNDYFDQ